MNREEISALSVLAGLGLIVLFVAALTGALRLQVPYERVIYVPCPADARSVT
jgi:hypothetical protein